MAEKKGLQKIGLQIPKIVLKAAGNDPKRLKKIRELFGKKKQPKLPGMKSGSGENGVIYSDKKGKRISKEEARKRFDRADAAERRERGMSKQKPYPPGMKEGGMSDYYKDIL